MTAKTRAQLKTDLTGVLTVPVSIEELRTHETNVIDSATFPADLHAVATSGDYNDLSNKPVGGGTVSDAAFGVGWDSVTDEAASKNALYDKISSIDTTLTGKVATTFTLTAGTGLTGGGNFTANRTVALSAGSIASLALADSAVQPDDLATVATTGSFTDLTNSPVSSTAYGIAWSGGGDVPTQGVLYTKIEALDAAKSNTGHTHVKADITDLNEADYADAVHTHTKDDITDFSEGDYATAAQGALADSAIQPGDPVTENAQTGTTYTLVLTDANDKIVSMTNASANTVTIPANASVAFPVGTIITVLQLGAGATTIEGDTGVTVNGVSAGDVTVQSQYQGAMLWKRATNEWIISGDVV